jgi:hypothetical protein
LNLSGLLDFEVINDLNRTLGAAENLDGPILLILAADNPSKVSKNRVPLFALIERFYGHNYSEVKTDANYK